MTRRGRAREGERVACKSDVREARAARRDVGGRLTSENRFAPPDTAHAPYLKERTPPPPSLTPLHPRSLSHPPRSSLSLGLCSYSLSLSLPFPKTALTSSFLTREETATLLSRLFRALRVLTLYACNTVILSIFTYPLLSICVVITPCSD